MPHYSRDPKRDHNFDNHPYDYQILGHFMIPAQAKVRSPGCWGGLGFGSVAVLSKRVQKYTD